MKLWIYKASTNGMQEKDHKWFFFFLQIMFTEHFCVRHYAELFTWISSFTPLTILETIIIILILKMSTWGLQRS